MGVRGSGSGTGNVVRNNLAYGNPGGDFVATYGGATVFVSGPANISGSEPLFLDRGANDFRPRANSPLIDRADPDYAPAADARGNRRVGPPDLGALEYVGQRLGR
jgi:hypothetical protein